MSKFTEYADSFQAVARLKLENIKLLTEFLDNPQDDLKFIHIAGTNGKGSVCSILQTALTYAGLKTGKYISPNLISVCERISVDGENIKQTELESVMEEVKKAADKAFKKTGEYPTQFELWTAAAFLYFKEKKVDIVILETGLGGDRDATNVVKNTICSVITKISYDHMTYLGDNIREIAKAKAGIIKENGINVTAVQEEEAMEVIRRKAKELNNELFVVKSPESKGISGICEIFDLEEIKDIKCALGGIYQLENAAIAAKVLKCLKFNSEIIRYGIENAKNPARFELLSENPLVVFDGAHNPDGVELFSQSIDRYFKDKSKNFVMAVMADKDIDKMADILLKYSFNLKSKFYTVAVKNNPRSQNAVKLSEILKEKGFITEACSSVKEAVDKAAENAEAVFVFGSLYLYKDLIEEKQI